MKMRKELNNKGFSLVELLIATIILGIVVAPLLHTFVTAANTTARSRQIGDATLMGENVAELVKATALKDLDELFDDPYFNGDAMQRELHKAIQKLPDKQKLVFNMRYFDEMKYEDISQITGTSVGALKASYHHAYNKIKSELEEKLIDR